jgi:RimJ/RimL family protein N-acetyltransferase
MPAMQLPIQTASLRLRHLKVDDAQRMMELNAEASTRRWLPSHVYKDLNEAASRMRYLIGCYGAPGDPRLGPYVLGVEHLASGTLLGHVGFSPFEHAVEVSYAIAEAHWGQRHGSEALLHACHWATTTFDLDRLLAITEADNMPSRRTLARAAFVHDEDLLMPFQGAQATVSRYLWHREDNRRPGA